MTRFRDEEVKFLWEGEETVGIHERKEIAVALKILFPDTMMNGADDPFEHAPNAFDGIGMNMPPSKFIG